MSLPPKPGPGRPSSWAARNAPATRPISESLSGDGGLASLLERVRASEARLQDLRAILPAELHARLRAGPLDDDGWTLLAANAAVAAKLRQMLPTLLEVLGEKGWDARPIKVRVHVPEHR